MSVIGKRMIYIGPADGANHKPLYVEGLKSGAGTVVPGTIVKYAAGNMTRSTTAATVLNELFVVADRDALLQRGIDDAWPAENMVGIQPRSGEFFNLRVATGQALQIGTALTRDGGGQLRIALLDGTEQIVAYSDEAVTTATAAPGELVRVRIA